MNEGVKFEGRQILYTPSLVTKTLAELGILCPFQRLGYAVAVCHPQAFLAAPRVKHGGVNFSLEELDGLGVLAVEKAKTADVTEMVRHIARTGRAIPVQRPRTSGILLRSGYCLPASTCQRTEAFGTCRESFGAISGSRAGAGEEDKPTESETESRRNLERNRMCRRTAKTIYRACGKASRRAGRYEIGMTIFGIATIGVKAADGLSEQPSFVVCC